MIGVPSGKLTLREAAQRYKSAYAVLAPGRTPDDADDDLKQAFADREIDAFVGDTMNSIRLLGWREEPLSELNFMRHSIESSALWRGFSGQTPYVDEAEFDAWVARKRVHSTTRYWTVDQALAWLAIDDSRRASESGILFQLLPLGSALRAACKNELIRVLSGSEKVAFLDGEAVPSLWFHGAKVQGVAGGEALRLNAQEFSAAIVRYDDRPETVGERFQSTPLRAMTPWISVEALTSAAARCALPALPDMMASNDTHVPIGWARLWVVQRWAGQTVLESRIDSLLAEAQAEIFGRLSQAPGKARACEIGEGGGVGDPIASFLDAGAWSCVDSGLDGHAEFVPMDISGLENRRDPQLGGTIYHQGRRWTRIEIEKAWALEQWPVQQPVMPTSVGAAAPPLSPSTKSKRKGGGRRKADWETYKDVLRQEVQARGRPDDDNDDPEWRSLADVERFLGRLLVQDGKTVDKTTIYRQAKRMRDALPRDV